MTMIKPNNRFIYVTTLIEYILVDRDVFMLKYYHLASHFQWSHCHQTPDSGKSMYPGKSKCVYKCVYTKCVYKFALLYDTSIEQAFCHTWDHLTLCAENGIVINAPKFQFCTDTVDFAGLTIRPTSIVPSSGILTAITAITALVWFSQLSDMGILHQ